MVVVNVHNLLVVFHAPLFLLFHFNVVDFLPPPLGLFSFSFDGFILLTQFLRRHDLPRQVVHLPLLGYFSVHHLFHEIPVLFGLDGAAIVEDMVG